MIGVIFNFGKEVVEVRLDRVKLFFRTANQYGGMFAPIESIKLDKAGVIKEHPDLKDSEHWRSEAIKRLEEKLGSMATEDERMNYVIEDLKKWGYVPLYKQKQGQRPVKL